MSATPAAVGLEPSGARYDRVASVAPVQSRSLRDSGHRPLDGEDVFIGPSLCRRLF